MYSKISILVPIAIAVLGSTLASEYRIRRFHISQQGASARLTWQLETRARTQGVSYLIEYNMSGEDEVIVYTTLQTSYDAPNLTPGRRHRFRVRAVYSPNDYRLQGQKGEWSKWISIDVAAVRSRPNVRDPRYVCREEACGRGPRRQPDFQVVTGLRVARQQSDSRSVLLRWHHASPAQYTIYIVEHTSPRGVFELTSNEQQLAVHDLDRGTHRFRVKVRTASSGGTHFGNGAWSSSVSVTIGVTDTDRPCITGGRPCITGGGGVIGHPVEPITSVAIQYTGRANEVRLTWRLSISQRTVSGYELRVSQDRNAHESQWRLHTKHTAEPEYVFDRLRASTTYYVKISVVLRQGNSIGGDKIFTFDTGSNPAVVRPPPVIRPRPHIPRPHIPRPTQNLCLSPCQPRNGGYGSHTGGCQSGERCVPAQTHGQSGWCMSQRLINAAKYA